MRRYTLSPPRGYGMSNSDADPVVAMEPAVSHSSASRQPDDATGLGRVVSSQPRGDLRTFAAGAAGPNAASHGEKQDQGSLSGGRRRASGGGRADGGVVGPARGRGDTERPDFTVNPPAGGYAWWYIDGVSDDGSSAVSVIGMIGAVFSPWYAWSGRGNPANHACINVATFGEKPRFTMTDRGQAALRQSQDALQVGPSQIAWQGGSLVIDINEISALPRVGRVQGQIRLTPTAITKIEARLTPDRRHIWRPFAPVARIEVDLSPAHHWQGHGYFDANFGTRPLEADFTHWTWGRYPRAHGASVYYDALRRDGSRLELGLDFGRDGTAKEVSPPPLAPLPRTLWGIARDTRGDAGTIARQRKALLEAPFYARTLMDTTLGGERVTGMHETLDLRRYDNRLIQAMVAMRVPRRVGWP